MTVRVGTVLYGFCSGHFGRNSYDDKRVEAIGADWVVARNMLSNWPEYAVCDVEELEEYTTRKEEDDDWDN